MRDAMNFAFLTDTPAPPKGRNVAVIGAGPSGLAAAGLLACQGYQVEVYDKLPKAGGLMVFGIPSERIPPGRIEAGIRLLERTYGVNFHLQTKICCSAPLHEEEGDHFSFDMVSMAELVEEHDAVIICTGSWKSRKLRLPGEDLPGVYTSLEFLFPIRAVRYNASAVSMPKVEGKRVAVIGGGHSAVDVCHSALRLGAETVHLLYRRTRDEAPCGRFEIERLEEFGVKVHELASPRSIVGDDHVIGVEVLGCTLGEPDESGRACPMPDEEQVSVLDVDMVVTAVGEIPSPPFSQELGLENVRKGEVRWLNMTSIENVFVAGDVLSGPSKIGKAVYSGLRAARSLANWLDLKAQNRTDEYKADDFVATNRTS